MKRIPRMLRAPALKRTENNQKVATYNQNFEDAPRASLTTRGLHLCPEFRRRSTRQRSNAPKTTRGSPLTARASPRAENSERVAATYAQNFEDAPRASVTTRGKQREGRHLCPEFRGRSTRQRHDPPETARGSPLTPKISRTLHTPASQCAENSERVTAYGKTMRESPLAPRILRPFHAAASRRAQNNERGVRLRPEFRGCSTRQHHHAPETARRLPLTSRI